MGRRLVTADKTCFDKKDESNFDSKKGSKELDKIEEKYNRLERRFLAGIFENSNHCMRPNKEKISENSLRYRPKTVYFSSISLSLRYIDAQGDNSHYEFLDNAPYKHLTYSDKIKIQQFEELVIGSIQESLKNINKDDPDRDRPCFIALNEFGFPFFRQEDRRKSFASKLEGIANEENAFILCGSSHCIARKQNIAILAQPEVAQPYKGEKLIEHPKFSPAINLGEVLAPRESLNWIYYTTNLGNIGVLVCFDALDPSLVLRQIYHARGASENTRIDLYVIPTFSENDTVRDQAEMLSYFTKSIVLYVNYQYNGESDNRCERSHALFISGADVTCEFKGELRERGNFLNFDSYVHSEDIWASIATHRLDYKEILDDISGKKDDFSPLMLEILSLAKERRDFKNVA